jgi:hypothetical protein
MHKKLQAAATTGAGNAASFNATAPGLAKIYITGSAGVGAGAVQLEEAHDPNYGGTWSAIGAPVTVVASTTKVVSATGPFGALRARISTNVTGGTVDVDLFSSQDFIP